MGQSKHTVYAPNGYLAVGTRPEMDQDHQTLGYQTQDLTREKGDVFMGIQLYSGNIVDTIQLDYGM